MQFYLFKFVLNIVTGSDDTVCSLRDDNVITSKPTWKLKHTTCILEYFECFCQMTSKSILVILSHTVLKLVHL